MDTRDAIQCAKDVLRVESESILALIDRINGNFSKAVEMIYHVKGRTIVTGIGKSGLVGKKIVATLTSTGTPALFLHPVEGLHGDLGIVTKNDVILAISNSGETEELTILLSNIRPSGIPVIAFTGNPSSTLAQKSDIVIDVGVAREACPFNLAPTSSTTAALAMGDALAVALIKRKGFSEKDFKRFHPGGNLGQRLMAKVGDVMISGPAIPQVLSRTKALEAIKILDEKNIGFVLIIDKGFHLLGILTDGDVRRFVRMGTDFQRKVVDDLMTRAPITINPSTSLANAVEVMQKKEITALMIIDSDGKLKGYIHLHDILGRGGTVKISLPM